MSGARAWVARAVGAGLLAGAAYLSYSLVYAGPRGVIMERLAGDRDAIRLYEQALREVKEVDLGLRAIAARTLGPTAERVDAAFRDNLFAVLDRGGLKGIEVSTSAPQPVSNPVGDARLRSSLGRELRKQVDFDVIRGTVKGSGSLDQVFRAAATIQAQPWVHRVDSFSIRPRDRERERYELVLGVATILTPALLATDHKPPEVIALPDSAVARWAAAVQKNVFKEPPAPVVARADPPPAPRPPGPVPTPYSDWKLMAVVQGRLGVEAWLTNVRSQERVRLAPGNSVADAQFVLGQGERAVFEIGGQQFEVFNGQTLDERRPVN